MDGPHGREHIFSQTQVVAQGIPGVVYAAVHLPVEVL